MIAILANVSIILVNKNKAGMQTSHLFMLMEEFFVCVNAWQSMNKYGGSYSTGCLAVSA